MDNEIGPLLAHQVTEPDPVTDVNRIMPIGRKGGVEIADNSFRRSLRSEESLSHIIVDTDDGPSLGSQFAHTGRSNEATGPGNHDFQGATPSMQLHGKFIAAPTNRYTVDSLPVQDDKAVSSWRWSSWF